LNNYPDGINKTNRPYDEKKPLNIIKKCLSAEKYIFTLGPKGLEEFKFKTDKSGADECFGSRNHLTTVGYYLPKENNILKIEQNHKINSITYKSRGMKFVRDQGIKCLVSGLVATDVLVTGGLGTAVVLTGACVAKIITVEEATSNIINNLSFPEITFSSFD
jgi:hypothetical protein